MTSYAYPQMPLPACVWYRAPGPPPLGPPDRTNILVSLSPVKPEVHAFNALDPSKYRPWTHIIRTAVDPEVVDNYLRGDETTIWPLTFYEIPIGSGHYYQVLWYHIVGAGFSNEHARIYAGRYSTGLVAEAPWFVGWH